MSKFPRFLYCRACENDTYKTLWNLDHFSSFRVERIVDKSHRTFSGKIVFRDTGILYGTYPPYSLNLGNRRKNEVAIAFIDYNIDCAGYSLPEIIKHLTLDLDKVDTFESSEIFFEKKPGDK